MSLWDMLSYPFRSAPRRPLSAIQPERATDLDGQVPLGLEAMDLEAVARSNRQNDALERIHSAPGAGSAPLGGKQTQNLATHVALMPDDETYAARYHRAFKKKGS
ncbi:MAG: hypothetical protein ABJL99_07300 [Aliishimia sp.]